DLLRRCSALRARGYTPAVRVSCTRPCQPRRRSSSILGRVPSRWMPADSLLVALALGLVLLNAFFVAAEFAVVRVRPTRVEALAEEGHSQARVVRGLQARMETFLSATQLGITLTSLALGWVGEPAFAHLLSG